MGRIEISRGIHLGSVRGLSSGVLARLSDQSGVVKLHPNGQWFYYRHPEANKSEGDTCSVAIFVPSTYCVGMFGAGASGAVFLLG